MAVSDPAEAYALPSATLTVPFGELVRKVAMVAGSYGKTLSAVVVGLPLHADGSPSASSESALAFIEELARLVDVPVVPFDERRTTLAAKAVLASDGIKGKGVVDQVAAKELLSSYIAALFNGERSETGATLARIREQGKKDGVPMVRARTAQAIVDALRQKQCRTLLEIGTAQGYSAALFAYSLPFISITTLEKDKADHARAAANLADLRRVRCVHADAYQWQPEQVYDAVFLDGPKSRLEELVKKYWASVKVGGLIFVDNTKLGAVRDSPYAQIDRQRVRMLERMDAFVAGLRVPSAERSVVLHDFDDGLAVIERLA